MTGLTIGVIAKKTGLGIETIRFYEREGLLKAPVRSQSSGYRLFELDVVPRIRFIKHAKELGFTLNEIRDLLELRIERKNRCDAVKEKAKQKLLQTQEKIHALSKIEKALSGLIDTCGKRGTSTMCPILDAFDEKGG